MSVVFEKTLYLYGSGGDGLRFWTIRYTRDGLISRSYGVVGGKVTQPKPVRIDDAKKAMTKVQAEIKKKRLLGFGEKANRKVVRGGVFGPMGAQKLDEYSHKIHYPACVQRKYDGFRCLAGGEGKGKSGEVSLHSKSMKPFPHLQHIKDAIRGLGLRGDVWLDGELYSHGLRLNEISRIVMKKRDLTEEEKREEKKIVYVIFDMVFPDEPDLGFAERFRRLQKALGGGGRGGHGPLELATCQEVGSKAEVDRLHEKYLLEGYEGVIVRNLDGVYQYKKKSYDVLRTKEFKHGLFEIVGAKKGVGTHDGAVVWELGCGGGGKKSVSAMQVGTLGERRELYQKYKKNPGAFRGKKVRIKHLGVGADGCTPRNPVVEGFVE